MRAIQSKPEALSQFESIRAERLLLVEDEPLLRNALSRIFVRAGYEVMTASDGTLAVEAIRMHSFDVILSDIGMPGMTGIEFLRIVRAHDLDVPVILMTGAPRVETAMEAVALGAMQYLMKPVPSDELLSCVGRASKLHRLAQLKRDALRLLGRAEREPGDRAGLEAGFERCLATLWMAFQPIVDAGLPGVFAYEALLRSDEPSMRGPSEVLAAAERLGRLHDLGRCVRERSAAAFRNHPGNELLFVNLHTRDLLDADLYDPKSALSELASRVVLEITERAALDDVPDIVVRVKRLREMGFRIAIDDLGAGYAGLSSFVALEPEFVKLDMSLVRNVHQSDIRQRLVASLTQLCKDLGMQVLAEGIECREERDAVRALGVELLQGYFFARPGRPFPPIVAPL